MANWIDKILGDEGIKTDVQISVPPSTYIYLGAALFIGLVASRIVSKAFIEK